MDCDSRKEQVLLYALGTLDGPEQQELRAHLQGGCPRCAGRLSEAQAVLALLPLGLPPETVPPQARQRLLDRIATPNSALARSNDGESMQIPKPTRSRSVFWPVLIGGAIAAGITALVFSNILSAQRQTLQAVRAELNASQDDLRLAKGSLEDTTRMIRLISSPAVKVVDLKPMSSPANGTMARLIWDPQTRAIRLYAYDLKMLPPGRAYELWLINKDKQPHPAGTFVVNPNGTGSIDMTMPDNPGPITASAISEEQWNGGKGVMQPTMSAVKLQASLQ